MEGKGGTPEEHKVFCAHSNASLALTGSHDDSIILVVNDCVASHLCVLVCMGVNSSVG